MWWLLASLSIRSGAHVDLSLAERRSLEQQIREATRALNEAPLGPEAPWLRDQVFTAQLTLGWEHEAQAQLEMLMATTGPDSAWRRANGAEQGLRVDALIEEELRMLAIAWSARIQVDPEPESREKLAEVCATYRNRYPDEPRGAQLEGICPPETP